MTQKLNWSAPREITSGTLRPGQVVIPACCGIHKTTLFLIVRRNKNGWMVVSAVVAQHAAPDAPPPASGLQFGNPVELHGPITISHEYPGCPSCGDKGLVLCGCGPFSCKGATRAHGDHKDYLCGSCDRWICGSGKSVENAKAYANAALPLPPAHIAREVRAGEAARPLPRSAEHPALPRPEPLALPAPARTVVPRPERPHIALPTAPRHRGR